MIYSVFDWASAGYNYFDAPGEGLGVRPQPKAKLNAEGAKGHALEELLVVVPAGARFVGTGSEARGRVAVGGVAVKQSLGNADFVGSINTPSQRMAFGAVEDNPLVKSPVWTLVLWAGAVWIGFRVAESVGKRIAGVR